MNAFESGARKAIPAVLVYVRRGDEVLMIHRNGREGDYHSGKWNGLGGKCEAGESSLETARRELHEESGLSLEPDQFRPLGVIHFPDFKPHKSEDWVVSVFSARIPEQTELPSQRSSEGDLHWVDAQKVLELNLWAGDRYFVPLVLAGKPFMGCIWYLGEVVTRHWVAEL